MTMGAGRMTMHTLFLKEHDDQGIHVPNPIDCCGVLSSGARWTGLGSDQSYAESFVLSKITPSTGLELNHFNSSDRAMLPHENQITKGNATQFTLYTGYDLISNCKTAASGDKTRSTQDDNRAPFELGIGQSLEFSKHPYPEHCYGVLAPYGTQIAGRIMLPLSMCSDGVPIFVNAKQYNGILRRRKSRAKAVMQNNLTKLRKPYLHLSRHLHAMRRPRGNGGRFLNTKNSKYADHEKEEWLSQHAESQVSVVLQSDGNRSTSPTSGATSTHTGTFVPFHLNHLNSTSFPPFPSVADTGIGIGIGIGFPI